MVKNLQHKFIRITMLSLFMVLLLIVGATNGIYIGQIGHKSENLLRMLIENDGKFPEGRKKGENSPTGFPERDTQPEQQKLFPDGTQPEQQKRFSDGIKPENTVPGGTGQRPEERKIFGFPMSEETPFETRYFSVLIPDEGEMTADISHIAAVTEEEAKAFAETIVKAGRTKGYIKSYRYRLDRREETSLLVFVDCTNDIQTIQNFAIVSVLVAAGCLILVLILVTLLSGRAIRPVIEGIEKQKQFITDAGHEIKTPIAIILANTEVIEMCQGTSEWTESIHHQTERLNELVKRLLTLAKLDETKEKLQMEKLDFSLVTESVLSGFEVMAQAKKLHVERDIEKAVTVSGNGNSLKSLLSILMDNAVKYAPQGGKIKVSLQKRDRKAVLGFYNDCENLPTGDLKRLTDRFYRADESRSRESGGYGIGLSVARSIVEAHQGKFTIKRKDAGIYFQVSL